jgi:ABC-2 type transport system ATP-binding protein
MIEVRELRKNYNGVRALEGFSLEVARGELFGLVGPNGAGKSTLIKVLATLIQPDAGTATIAGEDVRRSPRKVRRQIGYMPDVPGLYHDMRVAEYLEFFADAFHLGGLRQVSVNRALQRSGLESRAQAFVEELSLGMKQRLVLAKTLLHEPAVLLLDEPATGLDPLARIDLREQLRQLKAEGVTILISSHILSDLEDICDRVAFIAGGRNHADSSGKAVLTLAQQADRAMLCEIEVLGSAEEAANRAAALTGVRVRDASGSVLLLEVTGGKSEIATALRQLVAAGVEVLRFQPAAAGLGLEQHYRKMFEQPQ